MFKRFLAAISFTLLFAACASTSDRLIGKWKNQGGSTVEFVKDGTLIVKKGDYTNLATWKLLDDKRLLLVGSTNKEERGEVSFKIEGKQLIVTTPDGKTDISERVE